jgi:hypothetical protein
MGVGLQDKLNQFQFERTVDWRVKFVSLFDEMKAMGGSAEAIANALTDRVLYNNYLFAQNCEFVPGMVTYQKDQVPGYYTSSLSYPPLKMTLYLDADMLIEQALQVWCMSGYMADGTMPINMNIKDGSITKYQVINPIQEIEVQRIRPFNVTRSFLGLLYDMPGQNMLNKIPGVGSAVADALDRNKVRYADAVLQWYSFKAYLQAEPKFSGTAESNGFRTAALICNVVGFERGNPLTARAVVPPTVQTPLQTLDQALADNPVGALGKETMQTAKISTRSQNKSWQEGR